MSAASAASAVSVLAGGFRTGSGGAIAGWAIGYVIALVIVLVLVALVVPILRLAYSIGQEATMIDDSLQDSVRNTAALAALTTTIEHAEVTVAGLNRGRTRLGG